MIWIPDLTNFGFPAHHATLWIRTISNDLSQFVTIDRSFGNNYERTWKVPNHWFELSESCRFQSEFSLVTLSSSINRCSWARSIMQILLSRCILCRFIEASSRSIFSAKFTKLASAILHVISDISPRMVNFILSLVWYWFLFVRYFVAIMDWSNIE